MDVFQESFKVALMGTDSPTFPTGFPRHPCFSEGKKKRKRGGEKGKYIWKLQTNCCRRRRRPIRSNWIQNLVFGAKLLDSLFLQFTVFQARAAGKQNFSSALC